MTRDGTNEIVRLSAQSWAALIGTAGLILSGLLYVVREISAQGATLSALQKQVDRLEAKVK